MLGESAATQQRHAKGIEVTGADTIETDLQYVFTLAGGGLGRGVRGYDTSRREVGVEGHARPNGRRLDTRQGLGSLDELIDKSLSPISVVAL